MQTLVEKPKSLLCDPMPADKEWRITDDERNLPLLGCRRITLLAERDGVELGVESRAPGLTTAILNFLRKSPSLPDDVRSDIRNNFRITVLEGEPSPELAELIEIHGERLARFLELTRPETVFAADKDAFDAVAGAVLNAALKKTRLQSAEWIQGHVHKAGRAGILLRLLTIPDGPDHYAHLHIVAQADAPDNRGKQTFWP